MYSNTGREYKPGVLVAKATVKRFNKPWSNSIDSGASVNYVKRCSLEGNPRYVEALEAHKGNNITVRLATGTLVTATKVLVNLGVKFFDFDSIKRSLIWTRDISFFMAWFERHETWIDWRSKTLGATRTTSSGALEGHEPTSARNQNRCWREPLADNASVLFHHGKRFICLYPSRISVIK